MASALRPLFVGERGSRVRRHLPFAFVPFVVTFVGYAMGVLAVSGGVVFVPIHAAAIGMAVGAWLGYRTGGLATAWIAVYASYLGFHAEWAFLSVPGRPLMNRLAFFVSPDGLAFLGVSSIAFGTVAFAGGRSVRHLLERLDRYGHG